MDRKNALYGAICGDIVGSRFEWNNHKSKDFEFFTDDCRFTDDSVMSLALYKAANEYFNQNTKTFKETAIENMVTVGRNHPYCGFGGSFYYWIQGENHEPYNSYGNGAVMRLSGIFAHPQRTIKEAVESAEVSHNHPESIKAVEVLFNMLTGIEQGKTKEELIENLPYDIDFTIAEKAKSYNFDVSCHGTMPVAIKAFIESTDFEDAIRTAISVGGDSDTIGAVTGSLAGVYYGVPQEIKDRIETYLDEDLKEILHR